VLTGVDHGVGYAQAASQGRITPTQEPWPTFFHS